ncbi:branched-chain amino acid ABC transporter substrate-binding protein [Microvirga arvi]|uniref:branched-chain amino acid ABC transporter substrate-binding protein n=1 Tax=Microvirga arvi TaxID=2778731 RepID=UPI0035572541
MSKKLLLTSVALSFVLASVGTANAQIKIGIGAPITGPNATYGAQFKNGVEMAVEEINAAGGVNGQKLEIVIGDDVSDPKQGVSVANKFAAEGVKFVVGHFNSGVSIPASEIYEEAGILQISPTSTNPTYTERGLWNTFRICGRDDQQAVIAGAFLLDKFKGKKVAILHDKTPYGKGLADETKKVINAKGLNETLYEGINPGEKDYSALVSKLKQSGIDLVYWGGLHTEAGLIIRQMRDQGLSAQFMGPDGIVSAEFASIAGPGAEGTLMTFNADPRKNPNAKDAVAKFRARSIEPEAYTLYSYAAVQVLKQAADEAKSSDGKKIANVMHSGKTFKTVLGDQSFDKKGDITRPDYVVYVWKKDANGKIDYTGNELTN